MVLFKIDKIKKKPYFLMFLGILIGVLFMCALLQGSPIKNVIANYFSSPEEVEVTVYNSNLGVVKEVRSEKLSKGINDLSYKGVASQIETSSVKLKSLNGDIEVLEQNYEYDLVEKNKILNKYIDKTIKAFHIVGDKKESVEATLLSISGNELILENKDKSIKILNSNIYQYDLPTLPEGLITKPTLHWMIDSKESKKHKLELSYLTSGMDWVADYVVVLSDKNDKMDLNGWVTINNNAGTTFKDANIKLIAGEVNRVRDYPGRRRYAAVTAAGSSEGGHFVEEGLFEYHMYDLNRKSTLKDKEQKQISFLESDGINIKKEYKITNGGKTEVYIKFKNSESSNLGVPLPAGKVKAFMKDSKSKLQFVGENVIDHTPKNEEVSLYLGNAFDIVTERKRVSCKSDSLSITQDFKIIVRNRKSVSIDVNIIENVNAESTIEKENLKHEKIDANTIKWKLKIKPDEAGTITYSVKHKKGEREKC